MTFPLAFAIGFSVASIPGPTIVLIATETLRKGPKAGLATMTAPVLMDALLMLPLGLLLQASLFSGSGGLFLGLLGAAFLLWLGFQSIQAGAKNIPLEVDKEVPSAHTNKETPSFQIGRASCRERV